MRRKNIEWTCLLMVTPTLIFGQDLAFKGLYMRKKMRVGELEKCLTK